MGWMGWNGIGPSVKHDNRLRLRTSGVEIDAHGAPQPAQDSRSRTISSTTRVQAALHEAELLDKPFAGVHSG